MEGSQGEEDGDTEGLAWLRLSSSVIISCLHFSFLLSLHTQLISITVSVQNYCSRIAVWSVCQCRQTDITIVCSVSAVTVVQWKKGPHWPWSLLVIANVRITI